MTQTTMEQIDTLVDYVRLCSPDKDIIKGLVRALCQGVESRERDRALAEIDSTSRVLSSNKAALYEMGMLRHRVQIGSQALELD